MAAPSRLLTAPSRLPARSSPVMARPSRLLAAPSRPLARPSRLLTPSSPVMAHPSRPLTAPSRPLTPPSRPLRTPRGPSRPDHVHIQFGSLPHPAPPPPPPKRPRLVTRARPDAHPRGQDAPERSRAAASRPVPRMGSRARPPVVGLGTPAWHRMPPATCHRFVGLGEWRRTGAFVHGRSINEGLVACSRVQPRRLHAKDRGVGGTGPVPRSQADQSRRVRPQPASRRTA